MSKIKNRLSWEEYALRMAEVVKLRSEDPYVQVGAVCLRYDHSIASVGFNGAPSGVEINWEDRDERRKRVIHAEVNALRYCQPGEVKLLASTLLPCSSCITILASYKVPEIIYLEEYDKDDLAHELCGEFGIKLRKIKL